MNTRGSNAFSSSQRNRYSNQRDAKSAAVNDFKQKYGTKFTAKYQTKPTSRPEHIPTHYGSSRVTWQTHNGVGGYYYRDALGNLILYSLIADAARRDRYMYRYGYDPSGYSYVRHPTRTVHYRERSSGGSSWILFAFILLVMFVIGGYFIYKYTANMEVQSARTNRRRRDSRPSASLAPPLPPRTDDQSKPAFWENLRIGDTITLTDEQTLELLLHDKRAHFSMGVSQKVKSIRRIIEQNNGIKWTIYELDPVRFEDGEWVWYLVAKLVDDVFDLRIMFVPDDFRPGTRAQLLDEGCNWIFQASEDETNFRLEELKFTYEIEQTLDQGQRITYKRKPQGVLYGAMYQQPEERGRHEPQFTTVVEYQTDAQFENPELLLVEIGGVVLPDYRGAETYADARRAERHAEQASAEGGYIVLLQGTNVGLNDIEVMPK